jgi:hypothetical protein
MVCIASFDIGIKNLSYCIIEIGDAGAPATSFRIVSWGIINLVPIAPAPAPLPPCSCLGVYAMASRAKKGSGGAASVVIKKCSAVCFTRAGAFFCKKHAKGAGGAVMSRKDFAAIKKKTIPQLREFCTECGVEWGDETLLKAARIDFIEKQVCDKFFMPLAVARAAVAAPSAKNMNLITAGRELARQLDAMAPIWDTITHVYIEQQMGSFAVRMKTIQAMVTQYFILRGAPELVIKYISPTKKLSVEGGAGATAPRKKTTYGERKNLGIELCQKILDERGAACGDNGGVHWNEFYRNYGAKRDDLADCFLQGIYGGL